MTKDIHDTIVNVPTLLRPQTFDDIVGQKFAQGVGKQIGKGIISGQGYLLAGPKGCGKTTTARIIAKAVNCENRSPDGNPCNECAQCTTIDRNVNPRVREINAARNRGIGEVKELLSSIKTGVRDGYLVIIFDEAHQLTKEAFSVLLKPIEEHAENIIFIMTTTNPESIPDTIVSRMNIIPIIPLDDEHMHTVLQHAIQNGIQQGLSGWDNITDGDIQYAISSAGGSPRQGLTTLSGIIVHGVSQGGSMGEVGGILNAFKAGDVVSVVTETSELLDTWDTPDPNYLVTVIINSLLQDIKNDNVNNPHIVALSVAKLAQLQGNLNNAIQGSVLVAKIASCVVEPHDIPVSEVFSTSDTGISKKSVGKTSRNSAGSVNKKKSYSTYGTSRNHDVQKEDKQQEKKSDNNKNPVNTHNARKIKVTQSTNINKLIYLLLNNDKFSDVINDDLFDVLNDEDKSEIYFDNGNLVVKVKNGGDVTTYNNALSQIISNIVVIGADVWDVPEVNNPDDVWN